MKSLTLARMDSGLAEMDPVILVIKNKEEKKKEKKIVKMYKN